MTRDTSDKPALKVLTVQGSGRTAGSVSRMLTADIVAAIEDRAGAITVVERDLADGVPFVDEAWIAANFTPEEDRSPEQRATLAASDEFVEELKAADVIVIGSPIYNFGVPAAVKAWVDMIARARKTFRYTENGPVGLLEGKKAYIVISSGGVPVDSPVDFATPYLRQALGFVGIKDVEVIAADQLNSKADDSIDAARIRIAELIHTAPSFDDRAA